MQKNIALLINNQKNNLNQFLEEMETCTICFLPNSSKQFSSFHCGDRACQNCMQGWISTLFERQNLQEDIKITCPFQNCGVTLPYQELRAQIKNLNLFSKIDGLYTKKCLRQSNDVAFCPMPQCDYAGILPKGACKEALHCEKCNKEWRHPSNRSTCEKITSFFTSPRSISTSDTWSNLKKVLFTVACPRCGIFIEKNGGCQHIGCTKCRYEFCWFCQQSYQGYRHQTSNFFCPQRLLMLISIYVVMGLVIDIKMMECFPFISWLQRNVIYWILVVFCSGVTFAFGVLLPMIVINENFFQIRMGYIRHNRWSCKLGLFLISLYVAVASSVIYLMYKLTEFSRNMLISALYGGGTAIVIIVISLIIYALYRFAYLIARLLFVKTKLFSAILMMIQMCRRKKQRNQDAKNLKAQNQTVDNELAKQGNLKVMRKLRKKTKAQFNK